MEDGLYLNGVWVADVAVVLNLQGNDLTKPDSLNATYSLSFSLPDSLLIRDLLENAEQIDSGGIYPYETLKAKLVAEGEAVFVGVAKLTSFKGGWNVSLQGADAGLFDLLKDKSIRSLDLSRYDHKWTLASITSMAGKAEGVVYPVIDYGNYDADVFAGDALFPAVYAHTIIRQLLTELNYRIDGDWLDDELLKRVALPFVDDTPQARDQDWIDARSARVTVAQRIIAPQRIDIIIPFSVDNKDPYFTDGKQDNFKPALNAYVCDTAMRLHIQAYQEFKVYVGQGAIEAMLVVVKNGNEIAQSYFSVSGPYNITGTKPDSIKLDEYIDCRAGDQIQICFRFRKRTFIASWTTILIIDPETTWAEFVPDPNVRPGDDWPVARNLPEITCAELLKSIALMCSATYQVDDLRKTLKLVRLDDVVQNTASPLDWSNRISETEEPELSVTLDPYAQKNNLKWKELDKVSPFGNGVVSSNAANLPATVDLFELAFAACLNSEKTITAYGVPVQILTRTLSGSGTEITVNKAATTARLVLIEPSKTIATKANNITPEGVVRNDDVTLTACWWGIRPDGATAGATNAFTLAFDRVTTFQREQTMINRYFNGLKRILRRPRSLTVSMLLTPEDVATLDFSRSIRLKQVRIGALDVSDAYFYCNKVNNYTVDSTCSVTLIPYY